MGDWQDTYPRVTLCRYCKRSRYDRKHPNGSASWRSSEGWHKKHGYRPMSCCHRHGRGGWGIVGGCRPIPTIEGRIRNLLGLGTTEEADHE